MGMGAAAAPTQVDMPWLGGAHSALLARACAHTAPLVSTPSPFSQTPLVGASAANSLGQIPTSVPSMSLGMPAVRESGLDESLLNLLMAWYWSGYYTGQYAARMGK